MTLLLSGVVCGLLLSPRSSFAPRAASPRAASPVAGSHARGSCSRASCAITMGFFDGLFQESEAAKAAKEEEWRAQQEMLAQDPLPGLFWFDPASWDRAVLGADAVDEPPGGWGGDE